MRTHHHQQGAVLIVSLIVLLLLTIIGVSGMRSTIMEEKMAQNERDKNVAFEAAESALRDAQEWVIGRTSEPAACDPATPEQAPPCRVYTRANDDINAIAGKNHTWWTGNATQTLSGLHAVNTNPAHVTQFVSFVPDNLRRGHGANTGQVIYRNYARGTGLTDNAQAVVEDTVVKRFN